MSIFNLFKQMYGSEQTADLDLGEDIEIPVIVPKGFFEKQEQSQENSSDQSSTDSSKEE